MVKAGVTTEEIDHAVHLVRLFYCSSSVCKCFPQSPLFLNDCCVGFFVVAWIPVLYFELFPNLKLMGSADVRNMLQRNGRFKMSPKLGTPGPPCVSAPSLISSLKFPQSFYPLFSWLTSYDFLSYKTILLHRYHYIKNIIYRPWISVLLVKACRGESLIIYDRTQNWGAWERIETRCLMQSGELKPQSSKIFEIHFQVFSWLNYL